MQPFISNDEHAPELVFDRPVIETDSSDDDCCESEDMCSLAMPAPRRFVQKSLGGRFNRKGNMMWLDRIDVSTPTPNNKDAKQPLTLPFLNRIQEENQNVMDKSHEDVSHITSAKEVVPRTPYDQVVIDELLEIFTKPANAGNTVRPASIAPAPGHHPSQQMHQHGSVPMIRGRRASVPNIFPTHHSVDGKLASASVLDNMLPAFVPPRLAASPLSRAKMTSAPAPPPLTKAHQHKLKPSSLAIELPLRSPYVPASATLSTPAPLSCNALKTSPNAFDRVLNSLSMKHGAELGLLAFSPDLPLIDDVVEARLEKTYRLLRSRQPTFHVDPIERPGSVAA